MPEWLLLLLVFLAGVATFPLWCLLLVKKAAPVGRQP